MSARISLWTGLIGVGVTIAIVQPNIANAKSSVEIAEIAKAITVSISEPNNVGSGVIIQRQGDTYTVLTAAHVVKNKGKVIYKITTPDDRAYEVINPITSLVPIGIDLAVVEFTSTTKYPTAKLGNCNVIKSGMNVYVGGFPGTSRAINQPVFVFREGQVSANSNKVLDNGYSLIYSNSTLPGMSGGAVLNGNGELIAIHGRGDRDENDVKTGFNLGISINRFAMVAAHTGIKLDANLAPVMASPVPIADDYLISAIQKIQKSDSQGVVADLGRAIQLRPKDANLYRFRAYWKEMAFQDYRGAMSDYSSAIEIDANDAEAYGNRAVIKYGRLNDRAGGIADLKRAVKLCKDRGNRLCYEVLSSQLKEWQGQ
jgi:hypothetical protein